MVAGLIIRPTLAACWISAASLIPLHSSLITAFRVVPILVSHENGSQQTRVSSLAGMELNHACVIHTGHPSRYWPRSLARPRQDGCLFAYDIFKRIFFNKNDWSSITISLKFVPKDPINNSTALVLIMAWRRPGDKSLSKPMLVSLPTHICVTRPQWVNQPIVPVLQPPLHMSLALGQYLIRAQWRKLEL